VTNTSSACLADRIDAALPQTQCTRCGEPDCRRYAEAIAEGRAPINRCPPGGAEGIVRLASISGQPVQPLDPAHGTEGPRAVAFVDEAWCIGCTLCIKACPVDCIVGAPKRMHTVIESLCTGCALCVPACPVDCIALEPATSGASGWAAWSPARADEARARHRLRGQRLAQERRDNDERLAARAAHKLADIAAASRHTDPAVLDAKRPIVEAALARRRARLASPTPPPADDEA
jgi:electron transport complex protein RnfB